MSIYAFLLSFSSNTTSPQFNSLKMDFTGNKVEKIDFSSAKNLEFSEFKYQQFNLKEDYPILNKITFRTKQGQTEVAINSNSQPEKELLYLPTKPEEIKSEELTPLTLEEAIEFAIANNHQLEIARLNLANNEADLTAEQRTWLPTLSTQTTLNRALAPSGEVQANIQRDLLEDQVAAIPGLESQLDQTSDPLEQQNLLAQIQEAQSAGEQINSVQNFATTQINGSVGLQFTAFSASRSAAIKIAREQVNFNRLEVERLEKDLRLEVANAYYDLQQSDRAVEIAENDVKSRGKDTEVIQRLMNAALATRLDFLNAQVELDNALQILSNAKAQRLTARRNIAQILSLPLNITPVSADKVVISDRWDLSLEETILLALENRVELEQQLAQRRLGKASVQSAWAEIKPQVSLFANYDYAQFFTDEPGDSALRGFGDGYSFGINFNWTIWDGGVSAARARGARTTIKIAEEQFADEFNQIRFEVEQAFYQLPALLENVDTANRSIDRAKAAVAAAKKRFKASLNTQTEVLDAQNRLIQAENNQIQAVLDYNRAYASLQRAIGSNKNPIVSTKNPAQDKG